MGLVIAQTVPGSSSRSPGFNPTSVPYGFVVDNATESEINPHGILCFRYFGGI
jgi:hypothetical protein